MAIRQTAGRDALGTFAPKFAQLNDDVLFGEVWSREAQLSLRDHSPVTAAALRTQGLVDENFRYPNYWGTMPMAVYTFLEQYDFTGKTIHPFCTHEGSGLSHTVQDIQKAALGAAVTKGLAIQGSSVDSAKTTLEKWVRENR